MRSGFRAGQVFGVEIFVDWSWLFIFFLITWDLGVSFSQMHPAWGATLVWGTSLFAAVLFFLSVLAHELAHSLVARTQGILVRNITLFLFGGVSDIQREPSSPGAEFLIAIVGPLTSFVIGIILLLLAGVSARPIDSVTASTFVMARLGPLATIALWLGSINVLLAIFNLIPGFPLDGGRVLRSILWKISGNVQQATRWASFVGQAVAWLFIFAGITMVFGAQIPFLGGGIINGLWLAFIGWFLNNAAHQSYQQLMVHDILGHVPVSKLMRNNPPTVPSEATISTLVHDHIMGTDDYAFPVVDGDQLVGMVTLQDVRTVPRDQWDTKTIREIMTPSSNLVTTTPDEDAADALDKLSQRDVRQLPVVRDGHLAGILRQRDIVKWLQLNNNMSMT